MIASIEPEASQSFTQNLLKNWN